MEASHKVEKMSPDVQTRSVGSLKAKATLMTMRRRMTVSLKASMPLAVQARETRGMVNGTHTLNCSNSIQWVALQWIASLAYA